MFYLLPGLWAVFCSLFVVSPLGGLLLILFVGMFPVLVVFYAVFSLVVFVTFARVVGWFFAVFSSVSG